METLEHVEHRTVLVVEQPTCDMDTEIWRDAHQVFVEGSVLTFGKMRGPYDEREPVHIPDEIERRYVVYEVKQRIHQAQFRGAVLPAYNDRCAICRLREVRLLDAAHIVGDAEETGEPVVSNGR